MNAPSPTSSPPATTERRQALSELLGANNGRLNLAYCSLVKGWTLESIGAGGSPLFRDERGVLFASSQDFVAALGRESVLREVMATFAE